MRYRAITAGLLAGVMFGGAVVTPVAVSAQTSLEDLLNRRQKHKNDWRNIAIGAGALGIYGLLRKDNTLFFAGTAGALYSAWRYEQDRKSQSKLKRTRATYFSKPYFYRDGKKYVRKTVWKNGKKYYRFARA